MTTVSQSLWFSSSKPIKSIIHAPSSFPNPRRNCTFKTLRVSSSSESSSAEPSSSSSSNSANNKISTQPIETDPVKLAFEKAKAYKKLKQQSNASAAKISGVPGTNLSNSKDNILESSQIDPLKLAVEKIKNYEESREFNTLNPVPVPVPELLNSTNKPLETRQAESFLLALEEIKGSKKSSESNTQNLVPESLNLSNNSIENKQAESFLLALEEIKGSKKSRESNTENPVPESLNLSNKSIENKQTESFLRALEEIKSPENSIDSNTENPIPELRNFTNKPLETRPAESFKLRLEEIKGSEKSRESNSLNPVSELLDLTNKALETKQAESLKLALEEIKGSESEKLSKSNVENPVPVSGETGKGKGESSNKEVPLAVKLALERAREYKQKKDVGGSTKTVEAGLKAEEDRKKQRDALIQNRSKPKDDPKISSIDFAGLNFADKKQGRGLPAGLVPTFNPFSEGELPEVEIIVGDLTKFGSRTASNPNKNVEEDENSEIYEPAVSTWGVFPRPRNISKTYGGGKVINPGDMLETEEESAAKVARARQLVAAYKNRVSLKIDPKLKSECEKDLKDGDLLMDQGNLKQALTFYQRIMDNLPFETELHGLAALQWSICQDSLLKSNEAKVMYEKLQSHPKAQINKKAKDFVYTFQAMEMMKVKSVDLSKTSTGYQNYFEAFVEDKTTTFPLIKKAEEEAEVDAMAQALPYIVFLSSPILFVLYVALHKMSKF